MSAGSEPGARRVVVVTGGAAGIGAAIAQELGRRGAYVVTMDPVLSLDGSSRIATIEQSTADRIVAAGGAARASSTSTLEGDAVRALFADLVEEFGGLDAVVNAGGISRATDFASGAEPDWIEVVRVHLQGYLNVLRAALPIMVSAGHGMILGVTSGSGWREANAGAYSCAKRAVAALTWQIGRAVPDGVSVNALSPIAATRMVTAALSRQASSDRDPNSRGATGGMTFGAFPQPEMLGPIGGYLATDLSWCSGQVIYSGGSEVAWISPPRLLEVVRTDGVVSLPHVVDAAIPIALAPGEAAQASNGAGNPRFGAIFDDPAAAPGGAPAGGRSCVIVTDDASWGDAVREALAARGVECVGIGTWRAGADGAAEIPSGFEAVAEELARVARDSGPIDAVVVALSGGPGGGRGSSRPAGWETILDEHAPVPDGILADCAWVRAATGYAEQADRPMRVVTVTDGTSSGGRSRAQAAGQLARAAHAATSDRVDAFSISVETTAASERGPAAELVAHLVGSDAAALSGAELVVGSGWFGLYSHPHPSGSIGFGGPAVPEWLDGVLRRMVTGSGTAPA